MCDTAVSLCTDQSATAVVTITTTTSTTVPRHLNTSTPPVLRTSRRPARLGAWRDGKTGAAVSTCRRLQTAMYFSQSDLSDLSPYITVSGKYTPHATHSKHSSDVCAFPVSVENNKVSYRKQNRSRASIHATVILARAGDMVDPRNFLLSSLINTLNLVVVSHTVCAYVKGPKIGGRWRPRTIRMGPWLILEIAPFLRLLRCRLWTS